MSARVLTKEIYPEVSVQDEKQGIVEFVASDETMDKDREVIRCQGWRFDRMEKNAPFINSHRYGSIEDQLGKVISGQVRDGKLVETVQYAIDVPENRLARLAFAMTTGGYLKAVSVGFFPTKLVTRVSPDAWPYDWASAQVAQAATREGKGVWSRQMEELKLSGADMPLTVYLEQQQIELSACLIGANPNALARCVKAYAQAHKAGVLSDADLETISTEYAKVKTANDSRETADAALARQRARTVFLVELTKTIKAL
jgi:hypothetical protein